MVKDDFQCEISQNSQFVCLKMADLHRFDTKLSGDKNYEHDMTHDKPSDLGVQTLGLNFNKQEIGFQVQNTQSFQYKLNLRYTCKEKSMQRDTQSW